MFKTPTAIVLGAGASRSYGYPTGEDLIDQLVSICKPSERKGGYPDEVIQISRNLKLYQSLNFYDPLSIDSFLMHFHDKEEFVSDAKSFIAEILLNSPREELFSRGAKLYLYRDDNVHSHWYKYLWDAIVGGEKPEDLADESKPFLFDIITFNYDNSLEYFLKRCIFSPNTFLTSAQSKSVLKKLSEKIHHVYGSLDPTALNASTSTDSAFIDHQFFNKSKLEERGRAASQNIRLINERTDQDYKSIQDALKNKNQLIFLGFGFDDINIGPDILNLEQAFKTRAANRFSPEPFFPVIKYTNVGDSEKINRKVARLAHQNPREGDRQHVEREPNVGIYKSTKKVYQALAEDFSLNDY